jgi:hypothetical protein
MAELYKDQDTSVAKAIKAIADYSSRLPGCGACQ